MIYVRVTIKDVAQQAGVSTSTVSLVLNNKPVSISQETRNAVLAVSLVTQKSKTLGLIIPDNSNLFFAELIQPPLTTVAQPIAEMASAVVEKLVNQIENPSREITAVPKTFSPVLKVRGSVRRIEVKQNNGGTQ